MRFNISMTLLGALVLTLGIFGCSSDGEKKETPLTGDPCTRSSQCADPGQFCYKNLCIGADQASTCVSKSDCPINTPELTCVNGSCLAYECIAPSDCNTAKEETCVGNKCVPQCTTDPGCAALHDGDTAWVCILNVCKNMGGDQDTQTEADVDDVETYVDPCATASTLLGCADAPSSCFFEHLSCSNFAGRDYTVCTPLKNDDGLILGQKVAFAGEAGDYFIFYNQVPPVYEAGTKDGLCYYITQSDRGQDFEGMYVDANHNLLGYVRPGNLIVRIECPGKPAECYDTNALRSCAAFPFPPFPYVPPTEHPLVCAEETK